MTNDKTELRVKENTQIRIAMSGPSGCGNTTVSTLLAKTLGIDCINYTFRNLAVELNIPFNELLQKARTDFSFDKMLDKKQIELASCRLAFGFGGFTGVFTGRNRYAG